MSMAVNTSNSPCGMYHLNPYYQTPAVMEDQSSCMYKLPRIVSDSTTQSVDENLPSEVQQLEERQADILKRLEDLSVEVNKISKEQSKTAAKTVTSAPSARQEQPTNGVLRDLVVKSSVSNPPLSLLVLGSQLSEQHRFLLSSHIHSSAQGVSREVISNFCSNRTIPNRRDYQLILTVIWRGDQHGTSLMVSPNIQTPIYGEANVARYLSRLLTPAYDSFDIIAATEIDGWLDLSTQLLHGNNKDRAAVLRSLNASLGRNSWVVGSQMTLADVVVWSALQQNKMTQAVPSNVKKWLENCNSLPSFQDALRVAGVL